jgi:hypothetical protein
LDEHDISAKPLEPGSYHEKAKEESPGREKRATSDTEKEPDPVASESGIGANAIDIAAEVKKRRRKSISAIPPPTPSLPSIEETEPQVNEHAGYVKKKKGSFLVLPPPETLKPREFDYIAPPMGGEDGGGGSGRILGYFSGTVAGSGSNPEPKQVDNVVLKAVTPNPSGIGNNGVQLALAPGDVSGTAKEGKLLDFIILVLVVICLCFGLRD